MLNFLAPIFMLAEAPEVEPTAFGLDAGGWVAMGMLGVFAILIWQKVPALVASMLDKKIADIRGQMESAAALLASAEALKAEYEAKTAAVQAQAKDILANAQEEAEALVANAKAEAKALVERRKHIAEEKIAAAQANAVADVRAKAALSIQQAATLLIAEHHTATGDTGLVEAAIARLN
jgi:F-type H+-transporting ATPase subunit b